MQVYYKAVECYSNTRCSCKKWKNKKIITKQELIFCGPAVYPNFSTFVHTSIVHLQSTKKAPNHVK